MYAVGRLGSYISRGVYTVSGPFHPFGGAVDIIVVEQEDGSFKSSAWNVCFGKFQGVLKSKEKVVKICVNGEEANFHMYLDNKGEAYFLREADVKEGESFLCPSSFSSDDTDEQSPEEPLKSRQPLKSKSCNYDAEILAGEKCNGKVLSRNNSRKSRIFGIFGNRSMKERNQGYVGKGDDGTVARVDSLERAEFAANLLDVQWSTSLATKKIKKVNSSRFSSDILDNGVNEDMQINSELRRVTSSLSDSAVYEAATFCNDQIIYPQEASPDIVSRVRRELDESGVIENDGNVVAVVSSITGSDPPIPHSAEMEAFHGSFDGKGVVPPDYVISTKDGEIDRVQSFIYCQSSGDPVVGTNGSGERTHETLYIARGGSGQVHLHAEAVHARTELISKDTAAEQLVEDIALKVQTMKVPETYTQETAIHSCTGNHNGDLEVPAKAPDPCGQMVHRNASPDSVEEIESHILSGLSNGDRQVQDEKDIRGEEITCDAQISSGYSDVSDIKEAKNVPQGILEEEQFLFSDSEELNITKVQYMESSSSLCENGEASLLCSPDPSKELNGSDISTNYKLYSSPETVAQENPSSGFEKSIGKLKAASTTIGISRTHEAAEKEVGRLVESLPNMWHQTDTLSALDLHYPLSHSLDSNVKTLKWIQQHKDDLNWKNLDREQQQEVVELEIDNAQGTVALKDVPGSPAVGDPSKASITSRGSWKLWPFRRTNSRKAMLPNVNDGKNSDAENTSVSTLDIDDCKTVLTPKGMKKMERASSPTSEQLASLNLKEGRNTVTFTFSTAMLGNQQVDARIYLWKWNARIVISDVDGTITKSDVLGQFMPMVGVDWSHTGVTHLFSAIKENGYEMLFLSARAISQAYHTRQFLFNLKQDGKALPDGPVVISPDGLFPSLFREVIRRAPHEFKIACLEDIKSLFPSDCNPFYAGFGNRDTDEISYLRVGIPLGKIFIINPKGKVVVNRRVDSKSYTSLHALVNGMFPPTTFSPQQEDFNSWNYWKLPLPHISV